MSKSTKNRLGFVLTVFTLILAAPSGFSQESTSMGQETVLTFVHDFLKVFYPEVSGKNLQLNLSISHPVDASWREISGVYFSVTRKVPLEINPLVKPEDIAKADSHVNPTLLGGLFWLRPQRYGRIQRMIASSDVVHSGQLDTLVELIESHPEWSEDQAIHALKQAGARYGPEDKDRFVKSLHLVDAEKFLGHLEIKSVDFQGLSPEHVGSFAAGAFLWVVQAEGQFPDGTRYMYGFTFEPFEGKLIGLSRISDR